MSDVEVFYEATPNPNSMKFIVTKQIATESVNMATPQEAGRSPLAQKIFNFPWAAGVFIGPTFVTISKQDWVDWEVIAEPLSELLKEHFQSGEVVLLQGTNEVDSSNDSPVVQLIKQILRDEIRPAVAQDGGDIVFEKFEDGRVYLHMQGSCAGCPSSAMTLKDGIETRLKASVPEVTEVISV